MPDAGALVVCLAGEWCKPPFQVFVSHVTLLGDAAYDIAAGKSAGVGVIALRCDGYYDLWLKEAVESDDPADLLARYVASPPSQAAGYTEHTRMVHERP